MMRAKNASPAGLRRPLVPQRAQRACRAQPAVFNQSQELHFASCVPRASMGRPRSSPTSRRPASNAPRAHSTVSRGPRRSNSASSALGAVGSTLQAPPRKKTAQSVQRGVPDKLPAPTAVPTALIATLRAPATSTKTRWGKHPARRPRVKRANTGRASAKKTVPTVLGANGAAVAAS